MPTTSSRSRVAYLPELWTEADRQFHQAETLEDAFHQASCLAGGWYRRPIRIEVQVDRTGKEAYRCLPADEPCAPDWDPCYIVEAVRR